MESAIPGMTIPIQTPQIGTTGVVQQKSILEQITPFLESIANQKLANAQLENYRSLAEERKAHAAQLARDLQDQADAADAFYKHLSGAATRVKPEKPSADGVPSHQGVDETNGTLIPLPQFEKGLHPGAMVFYHKYIENYNQAVLQQSEQTSRRVQDEHNVALTDVAQHQAIAAAKAEADDQTTQGILSRADLTTDTGQRRALRAVIQQVGPDAADKLARTLNLGNGRYGHVVANGYLYITDSKDGTVRQDRAVGQRDPATTEAARRNAGLVVDLIDEQSKLIHDLGIGASKNPTLAAITEGSRLLGISTDGLSNWLRNDPEQVTRMLRTRFSHLYVGLLPHSRSAQQLLENLSESYWAPAGSGIPILQRAERDRRNLRRIVADLRDGKTTDWSRLPFFAQAAAAAAAEGNAQSQDASPGTTANPDDWAQGVPPQ